MKKLRLIIVALFILSAVNLFSMTAYQGLVIQEIKFEGLTFFTESSLRDNLQNAVGQNFSPYYAEKDLKRIYSLGAFKDIKIFIQKTSDDKLIITYKVIEYPKIQKVKFDGVSDLSESDLTEVMRLKEDSHYNPAFIDSDRRAIEKVYKNKGYLYTRIRFELEQSEKPNMVVLKVFVNEGEKILIEQIRIVGARNLDAAEMKKFLESNETTLIGGDQVFSEDKKKGDINRILAYARWKGYIFARVLRYDVKIDWVDPEFKNKRGYYIEIEIEEGEKYTVGDIDFTGNELFTNRELRQKLLFKKGQTYDELNFKQTLQNLYDEYRTQGYIYTKITVIEKYDREKKTVSFIFNIFDGDRAHIEAIIFRGNTKTKSYVLDRELRIWEGEIFNIARINRSKERLNKLGFFKKVDMDIRPSSEEGLVDLIYTVEPQRTGMISFGGGYGSVSGFTIFTEISESNLLGRAYKISARGEYGQKTREIRLSWSSPYLTNYLPVSYSFSVGLRWARRQVEPYFDRNGNGIPDKMVYNSADGTFVLVESRERLASAGLSTADQDGLTYNSPYGGTITYNQRVWSEDQWLSQYDYDANGDGVVNRGVDDYTDERYYKEYTLFARLTFGYAFAEYFSVFTGYHFSMTKLFGINQSGTNTYQTSYTGPTQYASHNLFYIHTGFLYEDIPGAKTSFKNSLITENWLYTSKIPVGVAFDSTDNNFNPTKGLSFSFVWNFVGIGGNVKFNQFTTEISYYVSLPLKFVWANRMQLDIIKPWFGETQPITLEGNRLSFDGINEARGWQDFVYLDRYIGYGKLVFSSELRWPIPETKDILWWVFFFDAGGINKNLKGGQIPSNLAREFMFSWGFGVRIQIPMFPIRLYGAQRLIWENGRLKPASKSLEFVFSIAGYF